MLYNVFNILLWLELRKLRNNVKLLLLEISLTETHFNRNMY